MPLAHVSLKRGKMPDWAETEVKNCITVESVCDVAIAVEKRRVKALEDIPILKQALANNVVEDLLISGIAEIVEAAKLIEVVNATAVSDTILQYLVMERLMSGYVIFDSLFESNHVSSHV